MKNNAPIRQIVLRFSDPRYRSIVRENTEQISEQMGFEEDQAYEICIAVDEAYANALEHPVLSADNELQIEVVYRIFSDKLEVVVKDSGCGFDCAHMDIPETLEAIETARGRGLSLIKILSDSFEVLTSPESGTAIKIVKLLTNQSKT